MGLDGDEGAGAGSPGQARAGMRQGFPLCSSAFCCGWSGGGWGVVRGQSQVDGAEAPRMGSELTLFPLSVCSPNISTLAPAGSSAGARRTCAGSQLMMGNRLRWASHGQRSELPLRHCLFLDQLWQPPLHLCLFCRSWPITSHSLCRPRPAVEPCNMGCLCVSCCRLCGPAAVRYQDHV